MFSVKVGTTNFDGTGSAQNLTNADIKLSEPNTSIVGEDFSASSNNSTVVASADYWNAPNAKELQVNAENVNVEATDFVDIDINLEQSNKSVDVQVINSKRGNIDTGSGNDKIFVQVETNNAGWSNQFNVNAGDGNDHITFTNGSNSQFTKINIDAGSGNDHIDLTLLNANLVDASERIIDAGTGNDKVLGSEGHETIFGGSGNDKIDAGAGNDIVYGGTGNDKIDAGAGNDFIDGGAGKDNVDAGAGDDLVVFDSDDTTVNGGEGFDALILTGGYHEITATKNFEAVIGQEDVSDAVTLEMHDGLIIALGGDRTDQVTFSNVDGAGFYKSDAELTSEQLEFIEANSIDIESLHAYETDAGDIVWSDVTLA